MNHYHAHTSGLDIIKQALEGRPFGDLLASGAALIINIEDRGKLPPSCILFGNRPFLCIKAKVVLLHLAGAAHIGSIKLGTLIKRHVTLLYLVP
jgi:hypothetical protein